MLTRLAAAIALAALAACGSKADREVARVAASMNATSNPAIARAHAEGSTLVVRYRKLPFNQFSDDEIAKLSSAGLCTIAEVRKFLATGASMRIEVPRDTGLVSVGVARCDGEKVVLATN